MALFENPDQIKLLRDLLCPERRADSSDDEESLVRTNNLTPAGIGPSTNSENKKKKHNPLATPIEEKAKPEPKSIEEWEAMQEAEDADILDTRKQPEYKMTYRQAVGTEDVFLQMGNRTGASASCEDLILDIMLPEDSTPVEKMNLSITEQHVDLATPVYRLKLPLPHPVYVDRCKAKYLSPERKLSITLKLNRELDYINF